MEKINATKARKNFFYLLEQSKKTGRKYLVLKDNLPAVYMSPATVGVGESLRKQKKFLKRRKDYWN